MTAPGIGSEFAGYRIEAILGRGGVGLVYLAEDLALPRRVALKILRAEYAEDPQFRERFVRESRLAASLDHLNIVPIYKAGEADGVLYIAMRYVEGTDLRRLLAAEGPMDIDRALSILGQVGGALDAAHAQGLCHRDVKPANILVTPAPGDGVPDQAYLVDFGITKRTTTAGLTQAGQFVGTLDYAAPEQIRGETIDARTDVYSLGCVLFECLGGVAPFRRDSDVDTMLAHLSAPRPMLSAVRPEMRGAMDRVVATAMAQLPDDRYGSATALVTAARTARPWTGAERRTRPHPPAAPPRATPATPVPPAPAPPPPRPASRPRSVPASPPTQVRIPPQPPRPAAPAPPPPPAPEAPPPPLRPPRPRTAVLVAVAGLGVVAVAAAVVLAHRPGSTGVATSPAPAPSPVQSPACSTPSRAPAPPGTLRLDAALLNLCDFAKGTVTEGDATKLDLGSVSCGARPSGEQEERRVAFTGQGDTGRFDYFNDAASFPTVDEAGAYLDAVRAAAQSCTVRRAGAQPAAPQLGDGTARVLFPSNDGTFTFDALYVRKGRVVELIMVSDAGTAPPASHAEAFARVALGHMTGAGA